MAISLIFLISWLDKIYDEDVFYYATKGYTVYFPSLNKHNQMFIPVTCGKSTYNMIIDTGSPDTYISEDYSKANHFKRTPYEKAVGTNFIGVTSVKWVCEARNVLIGGVLVDRLVLMTLDLEKLNRAYEGAGQDRIDGIIGSDVLSKRKVIIDYRKNRIFIQR